MVLNYVNPKSINTTLRVKKKKTTANYWPYYLY